ncbi:MAG: hydrogenase maturation protease [Bryobacteraceae bacterium]|nr:hydrogenase maturation protease [Bryobacteraceae bacterium]
MGDDGIGWRLFEHLRVHGGLPQGWDLLFAGTDLLAVAGEMEGRQYVVLADAMESRAPAGTVEIMEADEFAGVADSAGAHQLAAVEALRLIQLTSDGVRRVRFLLFGIAVETVRCADNLSPQLEASFPEIVRALLTLARKISRTHPHRP